MLKHTMLALTLLALTTGVAAAQGTDIGGTVGGPTTTPEVTPPPTTTAPSGDAFVKGTLGISVPFLTIEQFTNLAVAEPVPKIDVVYFLSDKAALDLIVGINLHKEQVTNATGMTNDTTIFGFAVGAGYRMYTTKGALHTFIEPSLVLDWPDSSASGTLDLRLAGVFGVERMIADWVSFSGTIGGGLSFANSFKNIQLATQAGLAVNLYWK